MKIYNTFDSLLREYIQYYYFIKIYIIHIFEPLEFS